MFPADFIGQLRKVKIMSDWECIGQIVDELISRGGHVIIAGPKCGPEEGKKYEYPSWIANLGTSDMSPRLEPHNYITAHGKTALECVEAVAKKYREEVANMS